MIADMIRETTVTSGTGPLTLLGAVPGLYRPLSAGFAVGEPVDYVVRNATQLEIGKGSLSSSTILTRGNISYSTNANALVNFTGVSEVYVSPSASTLNAHLRTLYAIPADIMLLPNSADWVVNAPVSLVQDSTRSMLTVAQYANGAEQGQGYLVHVPFGATHATIAGEHRPETSPDGSPLAVQNSIYTRSNTGSWSSATDLTPWVVAASSTAFQTAPAQTFALATLGFTAGAWHTFEFTRKGAAGADTYTGVWNLLGLTLEFR